MASSLSPQIPKTSSPKHIIHFNGTLSCTPSPRRKTSRITPSKRKSAILTYEESPNAKAYSTPSPLQTSAKQTLSSGNPENSHISRLSIDKKAKTSPEHDSEINARPFNDDPIPIPGLNKNLHITRWSRSVCKQCALCQKTCGKCKSISNLEQPTHAEQKQEIENQPEAIKGQVEDVSSIASLELRSRQASIKSDKDCQLFVDGLNGLPTPEFELQPPGQKSDSSLRVPSAKNKSTQRKSSTSRKDCPIAGVTVDSGTTSSLCTTPLGLEDEPNLEETPTPISSQIPTNASELHKKLLKKLERRLTSKDKQGFIYVLSDPDRPGLCKIGRSNNPARRRDDLKYSCGLKLRLECESPVGYYFRTEGLVHTYLSDLCRPYICKCGAKHGEWFEINSGSAKAAVFKWVKFMSEHNPYDSELKELQPFWKSWLNIHELAPAELNSESLRAHWDRILSPSAVESYKYKLDIIWEILWKFYWPFNAIVAWTATFVAFQHPVAFVLMVFSVIGTFVSISNDVHKLRHASMGPKRRTTKMTS